MLTDAERQRKEKRVDTAKRLIKMGGHSKDGPSKRKYKKAKKEAEELLEMSAKRKASMKKTQSQSRTKTRFTSDSIDYRKSGMTKSTVDNRKN